MAGYSRQMSSTSRATDTQHAAQNAMDDPDEIARFHDRCSDLMRDLLEALAWMPDQARPFPVIEDAIGWPRRRIASVLGFSTPPATGSVACELPTVCRKAGSAIATIAKCSWSAALLVVPGCTPAASP